MKASANITTHAHLDQFSDTSTDEVDDDMQRLFSISMTEAQLEMN